MSTTQTTSTTNHGKKQVTYTLSEDYYRETHDHDQLVLTALILQAILNKKYGTYIVWHVVVGDNNGTKCTDGLSDMEEAYIDNCIAECWHWYSDILY